MKHNARPSVRKTKVPARKKAQEKPETVRFEHENQLLSSRQDTTPGYIRNMNAQDNEIIRKENDFSDLPIKEDFIFD